MFRREIYARNVFRVLISVKPARPWVRVPLVCYRGINQEQRVRQLARLAHIQMM